MLRNENQTQVIVIPRSLRERVATSARKNERSISAEFRVAAMKYLKDEERAASQS
jgi:hypothetical protein